MLHRIAVDMMRPPQSLSLIRHQTASSEVARARARKVRRYISWMRMVLIACGDKDVQVKYGLVLVSFALAHKTHRQKRRYADKLHSSGDAEGARGRLDMICRQALQGRKESNVATTFPPISRDRRELLFRPRLMRHAYEQDSSRW